LFPSTDCILQQLSDPPRIEPFVERDENIAGQRIGRDSIDLIAQGKLTLDRVLQCGGMV
jgi:hypothetical protein